jgi:cell division protein FtsQ
MSDGYLFLDDPISVEDVGPSRLEKLLKRAAIVLSVALAVELVWFLGVTPCLPFARVEVKAIDGLSQETILRTAGIGEKASFITVNATAAEHALEALPLVESARVVKRFPDRLSIEITKRTAVAIALAVVDGRTVPIAFDRFGVVFNVGTGNAASALIAESKGPVISGMVFERPSPGVRLPSFLDGFLSDLERLRRESPALLDALSEIRVQKRAYDGYELLLYPSKYPVRVRIGAELNEEVLRYMMLVLDVLASKGIEADEIDFRTGTAAYRAKEASSG